MEGRIVIICGWFSYKWAKEMESIEGRMNTGKDKQILANHLLKCATGLGLDGDFVFQQYNDPKNIAKTTQNWSNENVFMSWNSLASHRISMQ